MGKKIANAFWIVVIAVVIIALLDKNPVKEVEVVRAPTSQELDNHFREYYTIDQSCARLAEGYAWAASIRDGVELYGQPRELRRSKAFMYVSGFFYGFQGLNAQIVVNNAFDDPAYYIESNDEDKIERIKNHCISIVEAQVKENDAEARAKGK